MEELLEKYKGAYASDTEEPFASPESSELSEKTDDEEDETDRDESDDASSGKVMTNRIFFVGISYSFMEKHVIFPQKCKGMLGFCMQTLIVGSIYINIVFI